MRKNMVTTCRHSSANKENEKAKFRGKMEVYLNQFKKGFEPTTNSSIIITIRYDKELMGKI